MTYFQFIINLSENPFFSGAGGTAAILCSVAFPTAEHHVPPRPAYLGQDADPGAETYANMEKNKENNDIIWKSQPNKK